MGCQLLDKKLGTKCLAQLLGIGTHRLKKLQAGGPDLRFGKKEYRSKAGTWTIDSFLQIMYHNIAETLPDRWLIPKMVIQWFFTLLFLAHLLIFWGFNTKVVKPFPNYYECSNAFAHKRNDLRTFPRFIRRGRASKQQATLDLDDDSRNAGYEEIDSDIDNIDELKEWMATQPQGHLTQLLPGQTMVRKYLASGTVMDLYQHYQSTQKMLGGYVASYLVDYLYVLF